MNAPDEGWADFTHTTRTSQIGAHELFERYREFQAFTAGLSRKELVARRWLQSADDDSPLATVFFDLPLAKQPTLFRKSAKADENLLAIWQARARAEAEYRCFERDVPSFIGLSVKDLHDLARLSIDPQMVRQLAAILSKRGVILVYVHS